MNNKSANTIFGLTFVSMAIAIVVGYVVNIINLLTNANAMEVVELILSSLGVVVAPLGVIMGWIYII